MRTSNAGHARLTATKSAPDEPEVDEEDGLVTEREKEDPDQDAGEGDEERPRERPEARVERAGARERHATRSPTGS